MRVTLSCVRPRVRVLRGQVGDFEQMVMPVPPARLKILLAPEDIRSLIVEALFLTADKVRASRDATPRALRGLHAVDAHCACRGILRIRA